MLKKIWNWIVYSSANPENVSLTLRGLAGLIPSVVVLLGVVHIPISVNQLTMALQYFIEVVLGVLSAVSAIVTAWGFIRKIVLTLTGQNAKK